MARFDHIRPSWGGGDSADDVTARFNAAEPIAPDAEPLPGGWYRCRLVSGRRGESRGRRTPQYELVWAVAEGEHEGRRVRAYEFLTAEAVRFAKGRLLALGIDDINAAPPRAAVADLQLTVKTGDDGGSHNDVRQTRVVAFEDWPPPPPPPAFLAPPPTPAFVVPPPTPAVPPLDLSPSPADVAPPPAKPYEGDAAAPGPIAPAVASPAAAVALERLWVARAARAAAETVPPAAADPAARTPDEGEAF